jgi:hypothetical protein
LSVVAILTAIQANGFVRAITKSNHLVIATLQIFHTFGFLLLLSSLVLMSLRLFGLALAEEDAARVLLQPTRLLVIGLLLAVLSGVLMFVTGPMHYFYNAAFRLKMLLLLLAMVLQFSLFRAIGVRARIAPPRRLAKFAVVVVLLSWFGIGMAGRAIGFV